MKVRYPEYYTKFSCIAGDCEDTCCAGWEIDIDDDTYEYYMQVTGEFGERLRKNLKEYRLEDEDVYESHGFILKEHSRCPFLNEKGLCDIILNLGEDCISYVCTHTPRNYLEYGGAREITISPSCAEAGRLIFGNRKPIVFLESRMEGELHIEESEEEYIQAEWIRKARDLAIGILQNREYLLEQRIGYFLQYAKLVQEAMNQDVLPEEPPVPDDMRMEEEWNRVRKAEYGQEARYQAFLGRMKSFTALESINEEWENYLMQISRLFIKEEFGMKKYLEIRDCFCCYMSDQNQEHWGEQVMVYYAMLMLSRSVDDFNFWGKAQFCVSSFLMITDMQLVRFLQKNRSFQLEDMVDVARVYAKEVEHSGDNLDYLEEEFLFEEIYQYENLIQQIIV